METAIRKHRNAEICNKFSAMPGNKTARIESLAREYRMAVVSIRVILKKNNLIGEGAV